MQYLRQTYKLKSSLSCFLLDSILSSNRSSPSYMSSTQDHYYSIVQYKHVHLVCKQIPPRGYFLAVLRIIVPRLHHGTVFYLPATEVFSRSLLYSFDTDK